MQRAALLIVAACGACGRVGFDPRSDATSTTPDDALRDTPTITGRHWVNRNDGAPGELMEARMVYHAGRGTVILYGGLLNDTATTSATAAMWELTAAGWQSICNPCNPPGTRFREALGYDPVRDVIVLSTGRDAGDVLYVGAVEWNGSTWANRAQTGMLPMAREGGHFVWDSQRSRLLLVGGRGISTMSDVHQWDDGTWSPVVIGNPFGPLACNGSCVTYDAARGRIYTLVDDVQFSFGYNELYSTDGTTWTQECSTCTAIPRTYSSIVYDPSLDTIYWIGGYTGTNEIDGTWMRSGTGFTQISVDPPKRDSAAVVYDPSRDVIVMYGGNGDSCGGNCAETWEFVPD